MNCVKILDAAFGKIIAFHSIFADITDDVMSALLLSQLFYWSKSMNHKEFYKTNTDLQFECHLTRNNFETARRKILELGIFTIEKKGLPCKTYYKIDLDRLTELVSMQDSDKAVGEHSTEHVENINCVDPQSEQSAREQHTININTENNPDINTEINSDNTKCTIYNGIPFQFINAHKLYKGIKRGVKKEFEYFQKKHKDWKTILPLLEEAVQTEINFHEKLRLNKQFCPNYKNFTTWINGSCWETQYPAIENEEHAPVGIIYEKVDKL